MPQLALKRLDCIKKQEAREDEIRISVDGKKVAGDFKIDKNDPPITLNAKGNFIGAVTIMLTEVDKKGASEFLGTHVVRATQAGTGTHTAIFNDKPSFDYRLTYEVSA
ncbi:MAG: hypothetical protein ACRDSR_19055 [Pseudonocardiaceae bacterium]